MSEMLMIQDVMNQTQIAALGFPFSEVAPVLIH